MIGARRVGWILALVVFLIYALLPTKNYYWDGVSFAQTIEDAHHWATLFHPNHLLYNLIGYAVYHAFGTAFRALYVLQALNAMFAACAVYCLFGILLHILRSTSAALALAALFAFSGTWWRFSTDADAYVPAVLLLLGCISVIVRSKRPNAALTGILHAFAMLVHQLSALFLPVALLGLWYRSDVLPVRRRLWILLSHSAVAAGCTLAVYGAAYRAVSGQLNPAGLRAWITSHSADSAFSFRLTHNLAVSIKSWAQLVFSGRPSLLNYHSPFTLALLAVIICTFAMLAIACARWLRKGSHSFTIWQPQIFGLAFLWLGVYAAFLFFWLPHNTFYKLFALPALILLVASYCPPGIRLTFRSPGVLLIAVIAVCNFAFATIPYSKVRANAAVAFAVDLQKDLEPGAVVYFSNFNTDDWLARYFNPRTQWKQTLTTAGVEADLDSGKTVWLDTTALDHFSASAPGWLGVRVKQSQSRELVDSRHRIIFIRLVEGVN